MSGVIICIVSFFSEKEVSKSKIPNYFQYYNVSLHQCSNIHVIMKNIITIGFLFVLTMQNAYADGIVTSNAKRLPEKARSFISQYFASTQISYIKIDKEFWGVKKYEVLLTDHTEIEFTSDGNWTEIECDNIPVPTTLIPEYVLRYIHTHFPDHSIIKIERDSKETEVELDNGFSITFNKKGEVIDFDD